MARPLNCSLHWDFPTISRNSFSPHSHPLLLVWFVFRLIPSLKKRSGETYKWVWKEWNFLSHTRMPWRRMDVSHDTQTFRGSLPLNINQLVGTNRCISALEASGGLLSLVQPSSPLPMVWQSLKGVPSFYCSMGCPRSFESQVRVEGHSVSWPKQRAQGLARASLGLPTSPARMQSMHSITDAFRVLPSSALPSRTGRFGILLQQKVVQCTAWYLPYRQRPHQFSQWYLK